MDDDDDEDGNVETQIFESNHIVILEFDIFLCAYDEEILTSFGLCYANHSH